MGKVEQDRVQKRAKHVRTMYLFITNKIEACEVSLKYCPTDKIWADILMKLMQGKAFKEMKANLMSCAVNYTDNIMDDLTDTWFQKLKGNVDLPTGE